MCPRPHSEAWLFLLVHIKVKLINIFFQKVRRYQKLTNIRHTSLCDAAGHVRCCPAETLCLWRPQIWTLPLPQSMLGYTPWPRPGRTYVNISVNKIWANSSTVPPGFENRQTNNKLWLCTVCVAYMYCMSRQNTAKLYFWAVFHDLDKYKEYCCHTTG